MVARFSSRRWAEGGEMIRVRRLAALIVLTLLPLMSGCWGRQEIEDFAFVTMAGVDLGPNPGEVVLTVHIATPSAIAGTGVMTDERRLSIVSSTGPTVGAASENLAEMLPRRITWAHSTVIAIGEEYARAGIAGLIDFLARAESTRETAVLVVVKGGTASDLMNVEHGLEQMPSAAVLDVVRNGAYMTSTSVVSTVNDVLKLLETPGIDVTMARIQVRPLEVAVERSTGSPDAQERSAGPAGAPKQSMDVTGAQERSMNAPGVLKRAALLRAVEADGVAVFRGDQLVGWLNRDQSRGLQWLRGKVASAVVLVTSPGDAQTTVSMRARSARTQVSTVMTGGRPVVSVEAEIVATIGDSEKPPGSDDPEGTRGLKTALEFVVQSEVAAVIDETARRLQSDIFSFGTALYRTDPRGWIQLESQWSNLLPLIEVSIDIQARLP
jgi:spore germination protein KC